MTQRKEKKYFSKKNKDKSSLKSSQVECFNYREKRHFASNCFIQKKKLIYIILEIDVWFQKEIFEMFF